MTAGRNSAARIAAGDRGEPRSAIVQPGHNCWRVDRADRFRCIQDAADYFRWTREALLRARHSIFIVGWDIQANLDLLPGADPPVTSPPTRLDALLAFVVRRRPQLRCYVLIWDHAALYTLERDPLSRWRLGWRMPRQVRFGFDDHHPVGGSHHQKIVVVDDAVAFCGGVDLTGHRWDTSAHRIEEPARTTAIGTPYGPYHEVQAMLSGPAAASLGALVRDRWRALGEEPRQPQVGASDALWPDDAEPDLSDVDVAIARTMPASERGPGVRECEQLFLDSIAAAEREIYIESQYFTNDVLSAALADRLREPDGPEAIVVVPRHCEGWLERQTMGALRDGVLRDLMAADRHGRLRLVYPAASRSQDVPTFVHSKVMIVDDRLVRIGSANFSRRSMGVDTECDVAVDAAANPQARQGVRRIRDRMLAEHLAISADQVAHEIARIGTLRGVVDARAGGDRTLVRVEVPADPPPPAEVVRAAADPDEPIQFGATMAGWIPPLDARADRGMVRLWLPAVTVLAVLAWLAPAVGPPGLARLQALLEAGAGQASGPWIALGVFLFAHATLIPLELLAVAAGLTLGLPQGIVVALLGSWIGVVAGYLAGRAITPAESLAVDEPALVPIDPPARRPRRRRRRHPAAGVDCQRRRGAPRLRRRAGAVCRLPGWLAHRPHADRRRAERGRRPGARGDPAAVVGQLVGGGGDRARAGRAGVRAAHRAAAPAVLADGVAAAPARGVRLMAPPVDRLRVATYNVHACVGIDGRYDPDRVAAVVSELDADIVAVQEFTYPATVALETRQPVVFTALDRYECALGPARQTVTPLLRQRPADAPSDHRRPPLRSVDRRPRAAQRAGGDGRRPRGAGARPGRASRPPGAASGGSRCGRSSSTWTPSAIPCSSCSATSTTGCPAAPSCTSSTVASGGRSGRDRFRPSCRWWRWIGSGSIRRRPCGRSARTRAVWPGGPPITCRWSRRSTSRAPKPPASRCTATLPAATALVGPGPRDRRR